MNTLLAIAILASPLNWDTLSEPMDWDTLGGAVQVVTAPVDEYTAAYERYLTGEPMLVFLTASWCQPCQVAKKHLPALRRIGNVVLLDIDERRQLADTIAGGTVYAIPRVVLFRQGVRTEVYSGNQIGTLAARGSK